MHERTNLCKIVAGSTRVFKILQGSAICILYNTAQIDNLTEPTAILQTPFLNLCGFENLNFDIFWPFSVQGKDSQEPTQCAYFDARTGVWFD